MKSYANFSIELHANCSKVTTNKIHSDLNNWSEFNCQMETQTCPPKFMITIYWNPNEKFFFLENCTLLIGCISSNSYKVYFEFIAPHIYLNLRFKFLKWKLFILMFLIQKLWNVSIKKNNVITTREKKNSPDAFLFVISLDQLKNLIYRIIFTIKNLYSELNMFKIRFRSTILKQHSYLYSDLWISVVVL